MIALQLSLFGGVAAGAFFYPSNEAAKKELDNRGAQENSRPQKTKPVWRAMTEIEQRAARAIAPGNVRYPVASFPKRFARGLNAQLEDDGRITDAQANCMWSQLWRFRRQIDDSVLIDIAGNFALPGWKN